MTSIRRALSVLAAGAIAVACSSSSPAAPVDAGPAPSQSIGGPCEPSVPASCAQTTDACSVAECDPETKICVRVAVDAGPTCGGVPPPAPDAGTADASDDATEDAAPDAVVDASDAAADASDAAADASDAAADASDAGAE